MQNAMPGLANVTALLSDLDKSSLDDASKKIVLDSLTDGTAPEPLRTAASYNRHQYRAALAWLRGAAGRAKQARASSQQKKKAKQARRSK